MPKPAPTQILTTMSGTTYELDAPGKRIRRLAGHANPSDYFGTDGRWRAFESISLLKEGRPLTIRWVRGELPEGSDTKGHKVPGTVTSPIKDIR